VHAQAAVDLDPANPRYRYNRGVVLAEHGRFGEAIADFDFALGHDGKLTYAYLEKGAALLSLDRDDEARKQWPLARASDPALVWTDWYEAVDHFISGRFAEAAVGFDKIAAAQPEFAPALLWQHLAHARAGRRQPLATPAGSEWPLQLLRLLKGATSLEALLAEAKRDRKSGDHRGRGEAFFFAAQKELLAGRSPAAEALLKKSLAVKAPRHAWKVAAERELRRLEANG
jgi:tetratricopeptide (TPR) repeat protein